MRWTVLTTLAMLLIGAPATSAQQLPQVSQPLATLIAELTSRAYLLRNAPSDSRPYADPIDALRDARRAAAAIAVDDITTALRSARRIGYELIDFYDTDRQRSYYLLREDLASVGDPRGWGAYLFNPNATINAVVEAPHPLGDSKTTPIAAEVFAAGARGLMIAGAHRKKADVPDLVESVFHQVHLAWIGRHAATTSVQVHGFAGHKHPFPDGAEIILSTGGGQAPQLLVDLDQRFDAAGFPSYAYNRLAEDSPLNRRLNGPSPGKLFRSLAATKNLQGRQARELGGEFLHVELERAVRHDPHRSQTAAKAIAATLARLLPLGGPRDDTEPAGPVAADRQPPPAIAANKPQGPASVETVGLSL